MAKSIDHRVTERWEILGETDDGVRLELVGYGPYGVWSDGEDSHGTAQRIAACLNACRGIRNPAGLKAVLKAMHRLLKCPALNFDHLEPEDTAAIEQAFQALESLSELKGAPLETQ